MREGEAERERDRERGRDRGREGETERERQREREREHPHAGKKNCTTTDLRPALCNGLFGDHGIVPRPSFVRYISFLTV